MNGGKFYSEGHDYCVRLGDDGAAAASDPSTVELKGGYFGDMGLDKINGGTTITPAAGYKFEQLAEPIVEQSTTVPGKPTPTNTGSWPNDGHGHHETPAAAGKPGRQTMLKGQLPRGAALFKSYLSFRSPARGYIRSGTSMPSRFMPRRMTRATCPASRRRIVRVAASSSRRIEWSW